MPYRDRFFSPYRPSLRQTRRCFFFLISCVSHSQFSTGGQVMQDSQSPMWAEPELHGRYGNTNTPTVTHNAALWANRWSCQREVSLLLTLSAQQGQHSNHWQPACRSVWDRVCALCKPNGRPWNPLSEFSRVLITLLLLVPRQLSWHSPHSGLQTHTHTQTKTPLSDLHPPAYLFPSPASKANWSHDVSNLAGIRVAVRPAAV